MPNDEYHVELMPPNWPYKPYRKKYAYSHYVAYWKAYGVVPGPGEMIHHKNEDKHDDRPENLVIMTVSAHSRMHALERAAAKEATNPTPHGITRYSGKQKCRCDVCREAWNTYNREYKRQRFGSAPRADIPEHGVQAYRRPNGKGCRCEVCRAAWTAFCKAKREEV